MDVLFIGIGLIIVGAIALAIYEHRKKVTLLKHDFNLEGSEQTEAQREVERAADVFTNNIHR